MPRQKEKFVVNSKGRPVSVILDVKEYREMLRGLEELESIKAYDNAKASADEVISFDAAVEEIERSRR